MSHTFERHGDGPLAFPVTPFAEDLSLDLPAFEEHLEWMLAHRPPALFIACGTGEFASLSPEEVGALTAVAVRLSAGSVPIYVGAGQSMTAAASYARAAAAAGAVGLLLFPPYQREAEPAGVVEFVRRVARATDLSVVLYQRDGIAYEPELLTPLLEIDSIIGLKDGLGDIERMRRIMATVGSRLTYFNGMPTAETYQPSYAAAGVPYYSSAVFNFVPEVSWAFWNAQRDGDGATTSALIDHFFAPLAEIRRKRKGYAISLVKTGVAVRRGSTWPVRPPLIDVSSEHISALEALVERALAAVKEIGSGRTTRNES